MIDKIIVIGIIIFSAVALAYTEFNTQAKVYDCTSNLNAYPKHIADECRHLLEEYRRYEEKKNSKTYI